ncbi:ABC-F family ATP-binding cassette domain-containing protein [Alicyclobacillus kakegawensis]|uniref:ABC-F family ATP-binding cassette domain-containing protein n=1 Tax=Alicyclobacillus kakegawensis TaxID=392012 RepID=UPI0009FA18DF|nr:ABC-F family ATP-binding cassette domain-containing protein [Alicyclobacillus kakegawensis]
MIVLQANQIEKQYDGHPVLRGANLVLQERDRVALIGKNGAGKTTLLRILVGLEPCDAGSVSLGRGVSIGYVAQYVEADDRQTVFDFVAGAFAGLRQLEAEMRAAEAQMADPSVYADPLRLEAVSQRYARLQQEFEEAGGYAVEARVRRVLDGLAFPAAMHTQSVQSLSGGQKTRLSLARLLATEPDILVLDEPTNYLDTERLSWLESYLAGYPGAVIVVSHDRYFLDQVATVTYELADGRTTRYIGNYSRYMEQRAEWMEQAQKRYDAQQQEIARMEAFIQKNIARASTTRRAQSRRKLLERMERLEPPRADDRRMGLRFSAARASGRDVLRLEDVVVGFPDRPLAGPINLHLLRGQRLAIIGPNGIGKSTLLKTLVGQAQPLAGRIHWGQHVHIGYYDQEQENLDESKTVLAQIHDEFPSLDLTSVRTALGRFLFRGEDVQLPVAGLSGGERSRLALCRLMLRRPNVLVLDEPTNHLDLDSREALEDALADYDGTILFVSHDRYFIDGLATHVLHMDADGVRLYLGNYSEYVHKRNEEQKWAATSAATPAAKTSGPGGQGADNRGEIDPTAQRPGIDPQAAANASGPAAPAPGPARVRSADLRKLRARVSELEQQITTVEERMQSVGEGLVQAARDQDYEAGQRLQAQHEQLQAQHQQLLTAWEQAAAELEALERQARQP